MSDQNSQEMFRENAQARVNFRVPIILEGDDVDGNPLQQRTYVENVTRRGAFVRTISNLQPGSLLSLQDADNFERRLCYVQVVWVRTPEEKDPGIGVKLVGDNARWIDYLVAHAVTTLGDESESEAEES